MLRILVALVLALPSAALAQASEPVQVSLARIGQKLPLTVPTFVDGIPITPLRNHRMVVFEVRPGRHQLSAGIGDARVTCDFTSEGGKSLYFNLSLAQSASAHALLYDLQQVEMITDGASQVTPLSNEALNTIRKATLSPKP